MVRRGEDGLTDEGGGGGGGDEPHGACLLDAADVEHHVRAARERALRVPRERDDGRGQSPERGQQPQQLLGGAAVGQREDDVSAAHPAQVGRRSAGGTSSAGGVAGKAAATVSTNSAETSAPASSA